MDLEESISIAKKKKKKIDLVLRRKKTKIEGSITIETRNADTKIGKSRQEYPVDSIYCASEVLIFATTTTKIIRGIPCIFFFH